MLISYNGHMCNLAVEERLQMFALLYRFIDSYFKTAIEQTTNDSDMC